MNFKHMVITGFKKVCEFKPLLKAESLIVGAINGLSEAPKEESQEPKKAVEVV